jgi:hypothetical protein
MIQRTINNVIDTFYNVIEYPEYITSVMVGPSEDQSKNGKICVKVTVSDISQTDNETKDIDEIIGLLPSSFISNGVSYDVEVRYGIHKSFTCQEDYPEFYYWQDGEVTNRNVHRPVKGGISVTNYTDLSSSRGTFGFTAIDNDTNSVVGVTNVHVIIKDGFYASERDVSQPFYPVENSANAIITQPNEVTQGFSYRIGEVKKYQPFISLGSTSTVGVNKIDSATFSLDLLNGQGDTITSTESYKQLGFEDFNSGNGFDFATSEEIDSMISVDSLGNMTTNNELFISSRTTGIKGNGDMKIFPVEQGTVTLQYNKQNIATYVQIIECFEFVASTGATDAINGNTCPYPAAGGDSGSAIIANFNGEYKIVGQLFAGYEENGVPVKGVFCRIDNIAELLNISPWNSSVTSYNFSDTSQTEFHYVEGLSDQKTLTLSGKTFWQVGIDFI